MSDEAKISEVEKYLGNEFPGAGIEVTRGEDGYVAFHVADGAGVYILSVVPEFLADRGADEVAAQLPEFRVAETMRNMGDFGILLTNSGCVFA